MDRTVLWLVAAALLMFAFDASARFVSVDPVQANPNNGQNFNRYYYANNNPYRFTDPDGRQSYPRVIDPQFMNDPGRTAGTAAVAFMCLCDPDYVAPSGSGELQPSAFPGEVAIP